MSNNDEIGQALDWATRLSRDTWQIKDGRVSLDTPAHHILVKDIDQFSRMLVRRGYRLEEHREENLLYRVRVGDTAYSFNTDAFLYKTVAQVAEELDRYLAQGWKHMQCIQCGTPLLASFKWVDEHGVALKWYGVCSVQAGPYTKPLEACEGCGIEFDYPPPLRTIDDVAEEEARNAN